MPLPLRLDSDASWAKREFGRSDLCRIPHSTSGRFSEHLDGLRTRFSHSLWLSWGMKRVERRPCRLRRLATAGRNGLPSVPATIPRVRPDGPRNDGTHLALSHSYW